MDLKAQMQGNSYAHTFKVQMFKDTWFRHTH